MCASLFSAAFLAILSLDAAACSRGRDSYEDWIAARNDDERHQRALAADTAADADLVAVVEPVAESGSPTGDARETWRFRVLQVLKGEAGVEMEVPSAEMIIIGCGHPSVFFFGKLVQPGERHILYVKDGAVLRIASADRPRNQGWMPMWREISVVRKRVGAKR